MLRCEIDIMRWRQIIICTVLGGWLGFAAQFTADSVCWKGEGTVLTAEFQQWHNTPAPMAVPFRPRLQAYFLLLLFCFCLYEIGASIGRAMLIGAFLGVSLKSAKDQILAKRPALPIFAPDGKDANCRSHY
jgi:hypothetical protein